MLFLAAALLAVALADDDPRSQPTDVETSLHFSLVGREINERIEALSPFIDRQKMSLVCECGDADCDAMLRLTQEQYHEVRENLRTFVVLQGHESPGCERVLHRDEGWVLVEKVPQSHEHWRTAGRTDPDISRSGPAADFL